MFIFLSINALHSFCFVTLSEKNILFKFQKAVILIEKQYSGCLLYAGKTSMAERLPSAGVYI